METIPFPTPQAIFPTWLMIELPIDPKASLVRPATDCICEPKLEACSTILRMPSVNPEISAANRTSTSPTFMAFSKQKRTLAAPFSFERGKRPSFWISDASPYTLFR